MDDYQKGELVFVETSTLISNATGDEITQRQYIPGTILDNLSGTNIYKVHVNEAIPGFSRDVRDFYFIEEEIIRTVQVAVRYDKTLPHI